MPCYERTDFFREALESALNQTVKCKVIVIDNCSSHNYFEKVCKEKNVQYYRNDKNIGMAANFEKGFELAETKYVMNLQDDDQLSPEYVRSFLKAITQYPDLDIYFSDFVRLTHSGELPHRHTLPFGYMEKGERIIEYGIKYKLGFPYISGTYKRTKAHGFLDKYDPIGSYDWAWIYNEADTFSFYGDSKKLYQFRDHEMQDTKINSVVYLFTIPYIYDKILQEKVSDPILKKQAAKHAFWELVHLKSLVNKKAINGFLAEENMYSKYLNEKLKESVRIKAIYAMPKLLVKLVYKSMKKVGVNI